MKRRHLVWASLGLVAAIVLFALTARPAVPEPTFSLRSAKRHGARALGLYMQAQGWDVRAGVTDPAEVPVDTGVIIVSRERGFGPAEAEQDALLDWAEQGGRLIFLGDDSVPGSDLLPAVLGIPTLEAAVTPVEASPAFPGVRELALTPRRFHPPFDNWGVVLRDKDGAIVLSRPHGRGEVVALPAATPLANGALRQADNLTFAVQLLGAPGRSVLATYAPDVAAGPLLDAGIEAAPLPAGWRAAGVGLLVAAAASCWLLGRRIGPILPPEPAPGRPLTEYVSAQAHAYRRADAGGAVLGFFADALRRDLAAASGLPVTAPAARLAAAAANRGLNPADVEQLLSRLEAGGRPHPREVQQLAASAAELQRRIRRVR